MGNELLSQVRNVSTAQTSTTRQTNANLNAGLNMGMGSIFNMPKDYSNDFMMPDCLKTGNITDEQRASIFGAPYTPSAQPQQSQISQPAPQESEQSASNSNATTFSGQEQAVRAKMPPEQISEYYEKLLAQNPNLRITEKGNIYEVSNTAKKVGVLTGVVTALAGGIKKFCSGTAIKEAFNLKSLAVKLPVLAVAGWALGALIDAFTNSNNAQQADAQTQKV